MTKTIGLIRSKNDKKVFFLPNEVKKLVAQGHQVVCHVNYGQDINVFDQEYITAGAKIVDLPNDVIEQSEIVLLTSNIKGLKKKQLQNKVVISLANLLNNLDMVQCFINNKVIALQWLLSTNLQQFTLFNNLEKIKNNYIFDLLKNPAKPIRNICIVNDTPASFDLIKKLLSQNFNVKLFTFKKDWELNKLKQEFSLSVPNQQINFNVCHIDTETFNDNIKDADFIINMNCLPEKTARKLFTNELIRLLSKQTMLIDLASENGLCATFIHRYTKPFQWKKYRNILFSAQYDVTNNYASLTSKCISEGSINLFLEMLQKDSFKDSSLLITKNGELVHPLFIAKLHLFR